MKHTFVVVVLGLSLAGCRGATPDQKEEAQPEPQNPQTSTGISVEWTSVDLERDTSRMGYGSKPKAILARGADGALVFTPETAQDHIATAYTALQAHDGDRSLELVLDVRSPGGEACAAHLQDQAFNVLASAPCQATGEQRATAKIPTSVTSVRIYFQSPSREPLRLPASVRLIEHR